jgi:undecaprenyl diphosphate synthase
MRFNKELLDLRVEEFHSRNIKIRFLGRRDRLPAFLLKKINETIELTGKNTGLKLNIAYNYGGRAELVDAVKGIAEEVVNGKLKPKSITEKTINRHLYAPDITDYDMMIRTAGDARISNFLLWELAYSELLFMQVTWPDFRRAHLLEAIKEYNRRTRKFGALAEE